MKNIKLLFLLFFCSSLYSQDILRIEVDSIKITIDEKSSIVIFEEFREANIIRTVELFLFCKKHKNQIYLETSKMQYMLKPTEYLAISKKNKDFLVEWCPKNNEIIYYFTTSN
jgi:hypothetical protein